MRVWQPGSSLVQAQGKVEDWSWAATRRRLRALYLLARPYKARTALVSLSQGTYRLDGVSRMRELLAVPESNVPKPREAFPMTDDLSSCARCVFRRACGREGAAIVPPVA